MQWDSGEQIKPGPKKKVRSYTDLLFSPLTRFAGLGRTNPLVRVHLWPCHGLVGLYGLYH